MAKCGSRLVGYSTRGLERSRLGGSRDRKPHEECTGTPLRIKHHLSKVFGPGLTSRYSSRSANLADSRASNISAMSRPRASLGSVQDESLRVLEDQKVERLTRWATPPTFKIETQYRAFAYL